MEKMIPEREEPVGVPRSSGMGVEVMLSFLTLIVLSSKYDWNHSCAFPLIPNDLNFFNKMEYSRLSNAFSQSRKTAPVSILSSPACLIESVNWMVADSVERRERYPCCSLESLSYFSAKL